MKFKNEIMRIKYSWNKLILILVAVILSLIFGIGTNRVRAEEIGPDITGTISDITVKEGTSPTLSIAASRDDLTYAWEYKYYGSNTWEPWGTGNPFTPQWTANSLWQHLSYRVRVTDTQGRSAVSNEGHVTVEPEIPLSITKQPGQITVYEGQYTIITANTTGEGLHYKWQYQYPNQGWMPWGESDQADFTPRWTANRGWQGLKYRYTVTDKFGYQMTSAEGTVNVAARNNATITGGVQDITVKEGTSPTVSIAATGDGLKYNWEYKYYGSNSWQPWGSGKSFTPRWTANALWQHLSYRVKVTDVYGDAVYSNTGTVTVEPVTRLVITEQPKEITVKEGQHTTITAKATGEGLHYSWQYQYPNQGWMPWGESDQADFTPRWTANSGWTGIHYRYIVTDKFGYQLTSEAGRVGVAGRSYTKVTGSISNISVQRGTSPTVHIDATGDGLQYSWEYKYYGSNSWEPWGSGKSFTPRWTANDLWENLSYRAKVVDQYGNTEYSNTGIVTVTEAPTIRIKTTLPDLMVSEGEPAHLSAEAEGDGLTYTWQYQYPGKEWASWGTGNPYTTPYTANQSWIGIKYRVLVSDRYGNTSTSNEGSVDVHLKLRLTSKLNDVHVHYGDRPTFNISAIGNGLNYIWQYKYPNQPWMNWGTNYTDNPFTTQYTADASWNGIGYRVVVTDKWGESVVSEATIASSCRLIITLDPGHDDQHPGAYYVYKEQDLTLKIARYCKEELERYGVTVYMTRSTGACPNGGGSLSADYGDLAVRANLAKDNGSNALVSLHLNSDGGHGARGATVLQQNAGYNRNNIYSYSSSLAVNIENELLKLGIPKSGTGNIIRYSDDGGRYPDGSVTDYYGLLRRAKLNGTPAVIVEHCFLSSPSDRDAFLNSEGKLRNLGIADAHGILKTFNII